MIEKHQGATSAETFHTIQGLLDCADCDAVIPQFGGSDDIVTCPSCGSTNYAHDLADARVEEIVATIAEAIKLREHTKILLEALDNLQSRPNDPAAHRVAFDAMKKVRGT